MAIPQDIYLANLNITFSIYELPTPSASTPSLPRRQIDVRFSFSLDGCNYLPKTIRLDCEKPDYELGNYVFDRINYFFWVLEENAQNEIADQVVREVRLLACDLQVDIVTVYVGPVVFPHVDNDNDDDRETTDVFVEISSLKRKRIDEKDEEDEEDYCCVICLEELTAGTTVPTLSCGHFRFHDHCISKWLVKRPSCPLCRHKMTRFES